MYDVYIDGVLLPIAPEKITTQINGRNETVNLINDSEVNILKGAGLTTISFPVLLPNSQYPFARYPSGFKLAGYYLDKLAALKSSKKPFQFIVTRHFPTNKKLFNTNITCSLENYQIVDDAKNGFDIEVQINLKQFKAYSTKTFTVERPSPTAPVVVNPTRPASTAPTSSGGGNGGSSGGGGKKPNKGSSTKTYKVQIPGMSVLSIKASSVQDAISKAMGTSWTGTVYVNGTSYYVVKGKISQKPATKAKTPNIVQKVKNAVKTTVNKVKTTVKKVTNTVSNVISKVSSALKKAASKKKTTPKKPATPKKKVTVNRKNRMVMKN